MPETPTHNAKLHALLESADYQKAATGIRQGLREWLLCGLGLNWEQIHYEYGMYTINCRLKRTNRVIEKFERLQRSGIGITTSNFAQYIPDLVGGRLVVVDPSDLPRLADVVYERVDRLALVTPAAVHEPKRARCSAFSTYDSQRFESAGYKVEQERNGYCSIHFVFNLGERFFDKLDQDANAAVYALADRGQIPRNMWHVEVQVRTLMDEAWGESDHFVRYENEQLRKDADMTLHFTALAGYLQAANHHIALIRARAREVLASEESTT